VGQQGAAHERQQVAAGGVDIGDQDLVEDELEVVLNELHGLVTG